LAISGSSNRLRATSAYPPTGDIRWPMSVIVPIPSALPLKADVAAVGCESPKLTQSCHSPKDREAHLHHQNQYSNATLD
jgi:hypothetical protein